MIRGETRKVRTREGIDIGIRRRELWNGRWRTR